MLRKIRHYVGIRAELFGTKFRSRKRERERGKEIYIRFEIIAREIWRVNDVIDSR